MKKLSELMREGSKDTFQAFDDFFDWDHRPLIGCCALGAVLHAVGRDEARSTETIETTIFDATGVRVCEYRTTHPLVNESLATVYDIVTSLNDDNKWTREAIADWLQSIDL